MIQVLVVDDHPLMLEMLCMVVDDETDLQVAGRAANGMEAVQKYQALQPQVVVMDLFMPGMDGVEAMRRIREIDSKAGILALTSSQDEAQFWQAVEAGALGYLTKDAQREEIVRAIRDVAGGRMSVPGQYAPYLLERRGAEARPEDQLTQKERQVLALLGEGAGTAEIAQALVVSEVTVRTHLHHIQTKLRLNNRSQLVLYAQKIKTGG